MADLARDERLHTAQVQHEQAALDVAFARRDELVAGLTRQLDADVSQEAGSSEDATEAARRAGLWRRRAELQQAEQGLVFGRLDALDGSTRYVGRVGIPGNDEDDDPLVLDWRAAAARPFYTATPVAPQSQARRRHIRTDGRQVVGVDDEPLDGAVHTGLVGEGALLAALSQRRTGQMGTAVATLQREQDDVVRADHRGPLVVQGGPGTGKTVVALHRVAYLLFSHPQLAERGVLVVGPSTRFLDYIAQVLPALGETQVVSTTCDRLLPGVRPEREESRHLAGIKGRAGWQDALARSVDACVPRAGDLALDLDGERYVLPHDQVEAAVRGARADGRSYHGARRWFIERVHELLADAVAQRHDALLARMEEGFEDVLARVDARIERADDRGVRQPISGLDVDGALSDADIERIRERIESDRGVSRTLEAWWPRRTPQELLGVILASPNLLERWVLDLTPAEAEAVAAEPSGWAPSDIPLLDALAELLGNDAPAAPQGEFLAERAASRREWTYGHVVVDEAQELSAMQWRMVLRRCPSRSVTAVGDIDQTDAPHPSSSWEDAVGGVLGRRWTQRQLTLCYRTPREVMDLTTPILDQAGSANEPPRALRSSGIAPWTRSTTETQLTRVVADCVADLQARYAGGTVGVVAPRSRVDVLRAGVPGVSVLSATEVKGLEFDAAVVVDPQGIAAEPRGWNRLYVAVTRCTQELGQVLVPS